MFNHTCLKEFQLNILFIFKYKIFSKHSRFGIHNHKKKIKKAVKIMLHYCLLEYSGLQKQLKIF